MAIKISRATLDKACKEIIETILFCLPSAFKGTVYRIGRPPEINAVRVTSGVIDEGRKGISWGLPQKSDYNPPGKPWLAYRDEPGRIPEAMGWCVEKQRSWTAEDPKNDVRSVRLQAEGILEDYHHMEPVLIRKADLYLGNHRNLKYPRTSEGRILWQDSDYLVVAVIKIHFRPNTIRIGGPETMIIKRLSRALGTELLSYQLREHSLEAMQHLAEDKLHTCNILADSLRNAISKSGLILSLIKLELGYLREQWEGVLLEHMDQRHMKYEAVHALNGTLKELGEISNEDRKDLMNMHNKFLDLSLPPAQGENWVRCQIEERWNDLLLKSLLGEKKVKDIRVHIDELKRSLYLGQDPRMLASYDKIPNSLKEEWTKLIYGNNNGVDLLQLERLIHILENPNLNLPHQNKSRKSLIRLKALAEIMGQLEQSTNLVLRQVLNGHENEIMANGILKWNGATPP